MAYRIRQGRDFVVSPTGMSYTESLVTISLVLHYYILNSSHARFLYQLDHLSPTDHLSESHSNKPHPVLAKALDILFILHADHEMNASSTTVLQTGSSLPDPFSAVAAGCASL